MKKFANCLILLGIVSLVLSFSLVGYNVWNNYETEKGTQDIVSKLTEENKQYADRIAQLKNPKPESQESSPEENPEAVPQPVKEEEELQVYQVNPEIEMLPVDVEGRDYIGILKIPALGLELPVLSETTKLNLRVSPCRYVGTPYLQNMVICAHDSKAHFKRLKELQYGDMVIFTDNEGNVFQYLVQDMEILKPTDVEEMITGDWDLTLFTCTPGGSQARMAVRCDQIEK